MKNKQEYSKESERKKLPRWAIFLLGAGTLLLVILAVAVGWFLEEVLLDPRHDVPEPVSKVEHWVDSVEEEIDHWTENVEQQAESLLQLDGKDGMQSTVSYADEKRYQKGAGTIPDPVRHLEIHWIGGTVRLEHWDGDGIYLEENAGDSADHQLRWRLENGILTVQYCAPGRYKNLPVKDLVVKLPEQEQMSVSVETVSADCTAVGLQITELEFESASGYLEADGAYRNLSAESVSGQITVSGTVRDLDVETTSGETTLALQATPDEVSYSAVSGNFTMTLPGERSFELETETVSGRMDCELPLQGSKEHWYYDSGDAASPAELDLESVSGDLKIKKA